jgi:O-antigen/teichoic acid export membrane protein
LFAKDPATTGLFMMYGLVIPVNMISESSTGLLQISDRFRRIATINIVQSSITLGLISVIYINKGGLREILIAYLVGKTIGAIALAVSSLRQASTNWGSSWFQVPIRSLKPIYRELTNFAVHTNISATVSLVTKDSEVLWVSFLRNPVEAGYYKLALSLANIVQLPISPLPQSTYPELSRQAASKHWDNMKYIMRQGSILAGGYSLVVSIFLILLGPALIRLIYTSEYFPAYPALVILLAGLLVANTFYWRRAALLSLGHPDFPARVNVALAVIKAALMLVLVPQFGYLASAALLAGFYISGSIIYVFRIRNILRKKSALA